MRAVDGVLDGALQPGADLGALAVADGLDEELAEGPSLELELSENVEVLPSEGLSRLLELFEKPPVDVALPGLLGHQVPR